MPFRSDPSCSRFLAVFLLASVSLTAQSTFSSLTGVVTDASGARVPNTNLEVRNQKNGYVFTAASNSEGLY